MDTGCEFSEEELMKILRGINNEKPVSPVTKPVSSVLDDEFYLAPSAIDVLNGNELQDEIAETPTTAEDSVVLEAVTPLCERFSSKQWKERQNSYKEAIALISTQESNEGLFSELAPCLQTIADDINASANDSGLDLISLWASKACPQLVARIAGGIVKSITLRAFAGRPISVSKGHDAILKLMEVDSAILSIVQVVLEGTKSKKAKVPPECAKLLKFAYMKFGAAPLPNKEILSKLLSFFESKSKDMRAASLDLVKEMCRWLTQSPVSSACASLREATLREVQSQLDTVDMSIRPIPSLGTRKAREEALKAAGLLHKGIDISSVSGDGGEVVGLKLPSQLVEAFDLIDSIDLPKELAKTAYAKLTAQTSKWNEKKQGIDLVVQCLGETPKLKHDCEGLVGFVRSLKPLVYHSHQQVSSGAIRLFGLIAQGLREDFNATCNDQEQFEVLCGRLKDKKLVSVISEVLDIIVETGALRLDRLERHSDYFVSLVDPKKQPVCHARVALLEWFSRTIITMTEKDVRLVSSGEAASLHVQHFRKTLLELAVSGLKVPDPLHRDAAEHLLLAVCSTANKDVDSKELKFIKKIISDEVRSIRSKLADRADAVLDGTELINTQNTKATQSKMTMNAKVATPPAVPESLSCAKPKKGSIKKGDKKADEDKHIHPPAISGPDSITAIGDILFSCGDVLFSSEEAEEWNNIVKPGLVSTKWKQKVASFDTIAGRCRDEVCSKQVGEVSDALVVMAEFTTKSWSENNSVIIKSGFEMITACARACSPDSPFHKGAAQLAVVPALNKLSDRKLKESSIAMLTALTQAVGPHVIILKFCSTIQSVKSPAAILVALEWLSTSVTDFGAKNFPLSPICTLVQIFAVHKDVNVRSTALGVISGLYKDIGPKMRMVALPSSLSPSVAKAVEEALDSAGFDPKAVSVASNVCHGLVAEESKTVQIDSIERVDIGVLLDIEVVVGQLNDVGDKDSWKQRKAALEEVKAATLKSGHFLADNKNLTEVLRACKKRVADNQTNLKPVALFVLCDLIRSVDPSSVAKAIKGVAPEVLAACHDTKQQLRKQVIEMLELTIMGSEEGNTPAPGALEAVFPFVCAALQKPVGRVELLGWLTLRCNLLKAADSGAQLVPPILLSLQDKNKATREEALNCLQAAAEGGMVRKSCLDKALQDLAPSTKRTLEPLVAEVYEKITEFKASTATHNLVEENVEPTVERVHNKSFSSTKKRNSNVRQPESSKKVETVVVDDSVELLTGLLDHSKNNKSKRDSEFKGQGKGWPSPPEDPGYDALTSTWQDHLTPEAFAMLFPNKKTVKGGSMESASEGLTLLDKVLNLSKSSEFSNDVLMAHLDFILKWITIRICERESVPMLQQMLEFLVNLFTFLKHIRYHLLDSEAQIFLPYLLEKSGNSKERFQKLSQAVMELASGCCSISKYSGYLLACCFSTKKAPTRVICLNELARVIHGEGKLDMFLKARKVGTKSNTSMLIEAAKYVEATDSDVRSAGLHVIGAAQAVSMYKASTVMDSLRNGKGSDGKGALSSKAMQLIAGRLKANLKEAESRHSPRLKEIISKISQPALSSNQPSASLSSSSVSSRSATGTREEEQMMSLILETPMHPHRQQSRPVVSTAVKGLGAEMEEEDDDLFNFVAPLTPAPPEQFISEQQRKSSDIRTVQTSLGDDFAWMNDGDAGAGECSDDEHSLLNSELDTPPKESVNKYESLIEELRELLSTRNSQVTKNGLATILDDISHSLVCIRNDMKFEELSDRCNELLEVLVGCVSKGFQSGTMGEGNIFKDLVGYALTFMCTIERNSTCNQRINFTVIASILSTLIPILIQVKNSDQSDHCITSAINTVVYESITRCSSSAVIIALIRLFGKEVDTSLLNMDVNFFSQRSSEDDLSAVDIRELAPELAILCDSVNFNNTSVKKCVEKLLTVTARRAKGHGMFTLSVCLNMTKVSPDSVIFKELARIHDLHDVSTASSQDSLLEQKVGYYSATYLKDPSLTFGIVEDIQKLSSSTNDLEQWLQDREIPQTLREGIIKQIDHQVSCNKEEKKESMLTINGNSFDFLQKCRQRLEQNKTQSVAAMENETPNRSVLGVALGDTTNRSTMDRIAALKQKELNKSMKQPESSPVMSSKPKGVGSIADRVAALRATSRQNTSRNELV